MHTDAVRRAKEHGLRATPPRLSARFGLWLERLRLAGLRPSKAEVRQSFLNVNLLPDRAGGGAVFPSGLGGRGYRLGRDDFLRYCAETDERIAPKQPWRSRGAALAAAALVTLAVAGVVFGRNSQPVTAVYWTDVVLAGTALAFFAIQATAAARRRRRFLEAFPAARAVPRRSFLARRLFGAIAGGGLGLRRRVFGAAVLLFCALATGIYWDLAAAPLSLTLLGLCAFAAGLVHLGFALAQLGFRLAHGRAPSAEDLRPVSACYP